ncbi:nuclear transport factor 2 family protein [Hymenobacter persicinus]|uniref:Nuclear transport factor 2 family protein n=1 Tax=Hymenobacter persicinus TaxID=2025506 RepID=A0A4Q5LCZ4_9BACT|nr:nuclear transport factor 2 family protein [Hymenobacter persicinus]RYU81025.1 nuclear transport factor 2 family protein [Hymenobacter persicinus]
MDEHFAVVRSYLALSQALETSPAAYANVFHPQIEQIEYPNLLTKTTQRRTFEAILDNIRAGRELLKSPQFEDIQLVARTDGSVVLETHWHATIMKDFSPMRSGGELAAHFCMIFEFEDGLIIRHRTYRCYELFSE